MKFKNNQLLFVVAILNIVFKLFLIWKLDIAVGSYLIIFADTLNIFLIFWSGKLIFNFQVGSWSAVLYAISPWTLYYSLLGSNQIVFLTFLLLGIWGYFYLGKKLWVLVFGTALVLGLSFKGAHLFSDIGLINSLNQLQGILRSSGYPLLGRLIENKYSYLGRHLVFNFLKQFAPGIYFTDYLKLISFHLAPPVYSGFIFFFFYGLIAKIEALVKNSRQVLLVVLLALPSAFSLPSPDLAKLLLISPFIFWLTAWGLDEYWKTKDLKIRWLGNFCLLLVLVQMVVVFLRIE